MHMVDHTTARLQLTMASGVARARGARGGRKVSSRADRMTLWKVTLVCLLLVWGAPTGCGSGKPSSVGDDPVLADTLKALIEQAYDFTRPDVVEGMVALYPDSGRVLSASGGQIIASADSLRAGIADFWRNVGRNMRDPRWEWGHVYVDRLGPDAAVLTANWSIPHIAPTGRPHVIRGAWTAVFRRLAGQWKITVEHLSVPPSQ